MKSEHEVRILSAIQSNQFDKAKACIVEAYKEEFDLSTLLMYTAFIYEKNYQYAKAMRHYRAALDIDGTNEIALFNLYRLGDSGKDPIRYR